MGGRINTIMQTCFFAISGVLPGEEAIAQIKASIQKTYGKRGATVVQRNFRDVDETLASLHEVSIPLITGREGLPQQTGVGATARCGPIALPMLAHRPLIADSAPAFVRNVLGPMIALNGDSIPVSALPADGTYPSGTAQWEKRNIAREMPVWDPDLCIQCGKCVMVCPHAVIREKIYEPDQLVGPPDAFLSKEAHFQGFPEMRYTLQVSPEDCTGCGLCVEACPVRDKRQVGRKAINMAEQPPIREREKANWAFFLSQPKVDRTSLNLNVIKNSQLLQPLFEFSGACAGCGETPSGSLLLWPPLLSLMTQSNCARSKHKSRDKNHE